MDGNIEQIENSSILYNKGRELMDADRLEEAARAFRDSTDLSPHFKTLELLGECLIRLGRLKEAVEPLSKSVEMNRGVRAPSLLAEVYFSIGIPAKATEMVDIALSRDPTNRRALKVKSCLEETK